MNPEHARAIVAVVERIPSGKVATYGQVAFIAGLPRRARLVGKVLSGYLEGSDLPWHRVLGACGRIALPKDQASHHEQRLRLKNEGVVFKGEHVDMALHQWQSAESPLLD
jgi:methylated-DNA-protein-cysteine methyltransferase-like protein